MAGGFSLEGHGVGDIKIGQGMASLPVNLYLAFDVDGAEGLCPLAFE
jgi:hypothetical protein